MMGGQDIHFTEDSAVAGKKFANKLWNVSRFILQQIENSNFPNSKPKPKTKEDKEILNKLEKIIKSSNKDIDEYKFGHTLHEIYNFVWHDIADNYIEYSKDKNDKNTKQILSFVLANILKLLHPFMPFITEEIWDISQKENNDLLIIEKWPTN